MSYPDPSTVRQYLHNLGYVNIPQKQFEQFMLDLKTLIKHERSKKCTHPQDFITHFPAEKPAKELKSILKKTIVSSRTKTTDEEDPPSRKINTPSTSTTSTKVHKTQYIKPWNLNEKKKIGDSLDKTDPVKLFKTYQEQWTKLKLPGENKHQQVRWDVRNKMVSECPNPKPFLKKGSSTDLLNKKVKL